MNVKRIIGLLVLAGAVIVAGCQKAPPKAADRGYDIRGKVVAVANDKKSVTLDHEDIPGFMSAMKMEFPVADPKVLDGIAPGDQVQGRLKVTTRKEATLTALAKVEGAVEELSPEQVRAKLPPDERRLVDAQDVCAVEEENRLGSMGKPYKVTIKGKPVFLCCKGCEKRALADPDKTLGRVEELKAKNAKK